MSRQLGIVVGIDSDNYGNKAYRVLAATIEQKAEKQYDWKFECKLLPENNLIKLLSSNKMQWLNIELSNGKVHGSSGDLRRFTQTSARPYIIISQLINSDGKTIGYKIANYDGGVRNIRIKELLSYGQRCLKQNIIPVQNAIFVGAEHYRNPNTGEVTVSKEAHFKSYPGNQFIEELIVTNKNVHTENRKVNVNKNEKTLNKLEEIYTKEQIQQLKLGKQNGVQIRIYANPALSAKQMKELRIGLEHHVNVRPFAFPEYDVDCMRFYVLQLMTKCDIKNYLNPKYSPSQLAELAIAEDEGLDISKMSDPELSVRQMSERRIRMEQGVFSEEDVDGKWV